MAELIRCPDCGREISQRAAACPQCGAPLISGPRKPTVIEATAKKWKAVQLAGGLTVLLGGAVVAAALLFASREAFALSKPLALAGFGTILLGLVIWFYGGLQAWWHHG